MKGPSYRCAEGLGTPGRTITKRRTEQAGVPSTDVRAYTLIAGPPGAGPECGHRNRAAGTPATARVLEREGYRNAFGGCSRNRSCAAHIGRKLPSVQGVAEAVPAIASSFTTNIANRLASSPELRRTHCTELMMAPRIADLHGCSIVGGHNPFPLTEHRRY